MQLESKISEQVVQYVLTLKDELFMKVSVNKLAKHFEIERCKLSRLFKFEKEMTLERFLFQEKMFRAAHLLLSGSKLSIRQVSDKLGFCTCDYFIRKFKEYYGVVPGKYRDFKTKRSGLKDRRTSTEDRRQTEITLVTIDAEERRKSKKNRRTGGKERRKNINDKIEFNEIITPECVDIN